ncbi:hypothetical protein F5Y09DRAFT_297342 [Xylaria sp. FL1042]|nr:hypothetical protein F5Y09DRAFT_297342 [Xylaria sp. FL1042]
MSIRQVPSLSVVNVSFVSLLEILSTLGRSPGVHFAAVRMANSGGTSSREGTGLTVQMVIFYLIINPCVPRLPTVSGL